MASARQVAANRQNALKGGVKTEEGKAVSRLNARKHSIFVTALTAEDSEEICGYEDELIATLRPVGRLEGMLVEKIALTWLRIQRCARAEAEYHTQTWEDPNKVNEGFTWEKQEREIRYKATGVSFNEQVFERMVKLIDLYDTRLTNQFLKLMHEIERLQALRKGKNAPSEAAEPPLAAHENVPKPSEASAPAPEPPPAVDEDRTDSAAHFPSSSGTVPSAEEVPVIASEQSEVALGQEANAQTAI